MARSKVDRREDERGDEAAQSEDAQGATDGQAMAPEPAGKPSDYDFTVQTKDAGTYLGQPRKLTEPSMTELSQLADLNIKIEPRMGDDNAMQGFDVQLNTAAYNHQILMNFVNPPIDPDMVPARYAQEVQDLIDEWERWSGADSFLSGTRRRVEDRLGEDQEAG